MAKRTHYDASKPGQILRWGLCGFSGETDTDITKVDCRACRKAFAAGAAAPTQERKRRPASGGGIEAAVRKELALAPKAPPPPHLDPGAWAACCNASRGSGVRRCGECVLCLWERKEANFWSDVHVSAHNKQHRVAKLPSAPRWPNVNRALIAYAEYHAHERNSKSATAGILARIEFGSAADGGAARPDDPLQRAADDIVAVEKALHEAYPDGAHALEQRQRIALLLCRTPGVAPDKTENGVAVPSQMPSYEELSARLGVGEDELKALVNNGRGRTALRLFHDGLIPRPHELRRDKRGGQRMLAADAAPSHEP